jgi:hypothetical protein
MSKLIVNVEYGEVVERELNKAEKDQQKIDEANIKANEALITAQQEAKDAARQAILDRIGLTADELQTILG